MIAALLLLLSGDVVVVRPPLEPARLELWRAAPDERPGRRGFLAPILQRASEPLALGVPAGADVRAARVVAERLAPNGLRATLVDALAALEPPAADAQDAARRLARIGYPVDLLEACAGGAAAALERARAALAAGVGHAALVAELAALPFVWAPSVPGFAIATETGEHHAAAVRLQISSATDYARPGEGGALDVLRGIARLLPEAEIVAGVESKHLAGVEREARALAASRPARITLVESPLPLAQWAQDAAKPGFAEGAGGREVVWLAPRYASRGEDGSRFVAAENLALEGLAATGRDVRLSQLLFQGGNLLAVRDPKSGRRSLLVGEAEVARNRALGLSRDEVLAAFRAEFGVDSCVVLPAVSFHVDLEVCVRTTADEVVVCVLDSLGAARLVIHCGLAALERAGLLDAESARLARADVDLDRHPEFFARVGTVLQRGQHAGGRFALDFAQRFAAGPEDSGVGNVHRFLLALDLWAAAKIGTAGPDELGIDANSHAYLSSLRRREVDRMRVAAALGDLGWRVVAVPGFSDEERSLNALNGLHVAGRYLMPAYGGLFAPLDDAARERLAGAFGPGVRIEPVTCGETQRRAGGLHCAAAVEPRAQRP
ncbi:MAG: hypothetical protein JNK02_10710 [Planctomycetes bacterium]|nr:hypothetical protein [Planctomycetota bacterium]